MQVTYRNHMGDDAFVCDCARVSMDKVASMFTDEQNDKLIAYLARENHWSPFAHPQISLLVSAPIFVARQLWKSHVGLVGSDLGYPAWNEVSRRYVDSTPKVYAPEYWRARADKVKQGSSVEAVSNPGNLTLSEHGYAVSFMPEEIMHMSVALYENMIASGVCPEQARMVLPQGMYTSWIWTGSLAAFARICTLRLDPHTQAETRLIAEQIAKIASDLFPVSWEALNAN